MPQYFQRLLLFHLRHILKRPKALEAISKLPPCNEDASNVKESLVHMNLSPNQQLVFGSFAARQKSVQPAIDACRAAICHRPYLSFLVVLRYGQINSIPPFNNLSPSGSLSYPLSAMMRTGFFRGWPPPSTLSPLALFVQFWKELRPYFEPNTLLFPLL